MQFEDGSSIELPSLQAAPSSCGLSSIELPSAQAAPSSRGLLQHSKSRLVDEDLTTFLDDELKCEDLLPYKCGWLYKERPGIFRIFQPRWFVLARKQLRWYRRPDDKLPCGTIDFDMVPCEVECFSQAGLQGQSPNAATPSSLSSAPIPDGRAREANICGGFARNLREDSSASFRLTPKGYDRVFSLCAASTSDRDDWLVALRRHIVQSEAKQKGARPPELSGIWWKVDRVSPDKFKDAVETGDILLFRSLGAAPKIIRTFSSGCWDHVALLVRLVDPEYGPTVGLLESTGGEGVGIVVWDDFLNYGWDALYPSMAIRKVHFTRSKAKLNELQRWIGTVLGKPYGLTLTKLAQRKSVSAGGQLNDEVFFCSQLVAEALKVLQVIPRGVSSTQYWPAMFAAEQSPPIVTCADCSLEQQWIIDFSLGGPRADTKSAKDRDATTAWK